MNNEIIVQNQYNLYPEVLTFDEKNPTLRAPYSITDLQFYQTRESLQDIDTFRNFIKNAESRFRASRAYKAYKSYLMELGINRCQYFGNITSEDADIELHHTPINLFSIALMITLHTINTVGFISTFDLVQMLIYEHNQNNVGCTFLSKTAHQIYHNTGEGYIPPNMVFGCWWNLLNRYRYGITYEIGQYIVKYIKKYQDNMPISINIEQQEQILNYSSYNDFGCPIEECGIIPVGYDDNEKGDYSNYGF